MHRTPVIHFFVSPVFCVARFKHSYHSIYVLSCIFPFEMMKMLSLKQTTHISDGWIDSRQYQWFWNWREWQSTSNSSTRGHRRSSCRSNWNIAAVGANSTAVAGWASRSSSAEVSYQDFLRPPLFTKVDEPLDADAWIRTIKSKFSLLTVPCSEANKTQYAAQQLRGSARMWWDHYHGMQPADHVVSWNEFKDAFRAHHIPAGLLDRKLNEFLDLTQGTRTIL